jgi:hypothetical protein
MTSILHSRTPFAVLLFVALVAAPTIARAEDHPTKGIAAVLQPFVDGHSLAGSVTLVADKDKVLSLEAIGYADIAAGKPMKTDALF